MKHRLTLVLSIVLLVAATLYSYHVHTQAKQEARMTAIAASSLANARAATASSQHQAFESYLSGLQAQCKHDWTAYNALTSYAKAKASAPVCSLAVVQE